MNNKPVKGKSYYIEDRIDDIENRIEKLEIAVDWFGDSDIKVPIKNILIVLMKKLGYEIDDYPNYIKKIK